MFKSILAAVVVVVLNATLVTWQASAETLTGCLSPNGQLSNLQEGSDPMKPCKANQTQVTLQTADTDTEKFIFVTQRMVTGYAIGGLAGGNAICQLEAEEASLPGTYKVWLSTHADGPQSTFKHARVPYVTPDVVPGAFSDVVADNWSDLVDKSDLDHPIDRHADGTFLDTVTERVWTGTVESGDPDVMISIFEGVFITRTCGNWLISGLGFGAVTGMTGTIGVATLGWSFSGEPVVCNTPLRLFCVQQ